MKRLTLLLTMSLVTLMLLSGCVKTTADIPQGEIWYRVDCHESTSNRIEISKRTDEGFDLHAVCFNGANTGESGGHFIYDTADHAVCSGISLTDCPYRIEIEWSNDRMKVSSVGSNGETVDEFKLGFGSGVTISGNYSNKKPEYDYDDLMMEKVFKGDTQLEKVVKQRLGKENYESFSHAFGSSTYIDETVVNGHTVIRGFLRGISYWCFFSADKNGYFYGYYEDPQRSSLQEPYFSNDPVDCDNPPSYLMQH